MFNVGIISNDAFDTMTAYVLRSCHTAGRDVWNDFLGNDGYRFVKVGNLLASRLILMLLVCSCRGARWLVEQPEGSSLPNHPRFQYLMSIVKAVWLHLIFSSVPGGSSFIS